MDQEALNIQTSPFPTDALMCTEHFNVVTSWCGANFILLCGLTYIMCNCSGVKSASFPSEIKVAENGSTPPLHPENQPNFLPTILDTVGHQLVMCASVCSTVTFRLRQK